MALDDIFKLFSVREGTPQGKAIETRMIDAMGGQETIRKKFQNNPDGSVVMAHTRGPGAMPEFITSYKEKDVVVYDYVEQDYYIRTYQTPTSSFEFPMMRNTPLVGDKRLDVFDAPTTIDPGEVNFYDVEAPTYSAELIYERTMTRHVKKVRIHDNTTSTDLLADLTYSAVDLSLRYHTVIHPEKRMCAVVQSANIANLTVSGNEKTLQFKLPDASPATQDGLSPFDTVKLFGIPYHGILYTVGSENYYRLSNGSTIPWTSSGGGATAGILNTAWVFRRASSSAFPAPWSMPAPMAIQEALEGRVWLDCGIVLGNTLNYYTQTISTGMSGWFFVGDTGPVYDVLLNHSLSGKNYGISGITLTPIVGYSHDYDNQITIPLTTSITLNAAIAEHLDNYTLWTVSDRSDDGRVCMIVNGNAVGLVVISGEYPSLSATIQAVSSGQYGDQYNFSHALWTESRPAHTITDTADGLDILRTYSASTQTTHKLRSVDHDGSLLFIDRVLNSVGAERRFYSEAWWAHDHWSVTDTISYGGNVHVGTLTCGLGTSRSSRDVAVTQQTNHAFGPNVEIIAFHYQQTCSPPYASTPTSFSVVSPSEFSFYYKRYPVTLANTSASDLHYRYSRKDTFAVNPINHELFVHPDTSVTLLNPVTFS